MTAVRFVWIQWTNKFNNSIYVNVNVRKTSYSFKNLIDREIAEIWDRSTLFAEKIFEQVCLTKRPVQYSLLTRKGGVNGIFEQLTNVFKYDQ